MSAAAAAAPRAFSDAREAHQFLERSFGASRDALPEHERRAVETFEGDAGDWINRYLRTGEAGPPIVSHTGLLIADYAWWVSCLDFATYSGAFAEPVVAWRGLRLAPDVAAAYSRPGAVITDAGFCSVSLMRNVAECYLSDPRTPPAAAGEPVMLKMEVPRGTRGMIGQNRNCHYAVTLPRRSCLRVLSARRAPDALELSTVLLGSPPLRLWQNLGDGERWPGLSEARSRE